MEKNADLYARLVFCCLHEALPLTPSPSPPGRGEHIEAAFKYAAAAKGRAFVDLLASTRLDLAAAGADDAAFAADWAQYEGVRQEIDQLLLFLTGEPLLPYGRQPLYPQPLYPHPQPLSLRERGAADAKAGTAGVG